MSKQAPTGEEHARFLREIDAERDAVDEEFARMERAAAEDTFSGRLRTAIHRSPLTLAALIHQARVDRAVLQAFLIGEGDLPSSAIDRLVETLRIEVAMSPASREGE